MGRDLVYISVITGLEPILGKDRIELAEIDHGWKVIVTKGDYTIGDYTIYVEYDVVLKPRPELEFLRARCYSSLYDGFRIRNMLMAGVFSQGLCLPLSLLQNGHKLKVGTVIADKLGARKYAPEEISVNTSKKKYGKFTNFLLKYKVFRNIILGKKKSKNTYPDTIQKSNETNVQKVFNWLKENKPEELYYKAEKMEGQSSCFMLYGNKKNPEYRLYSHNAMRFDGDGSNWDQISKQYEIEKILRKAYKDTGIKYAIHGEICKEGVQKNIYKFKTPRLFVFKVSDSATGRTLDYYEMIGFSDEYGFETVPVYAWNILLPNTIEEVLSDANG